jgi:hypothetical protein
MSSEEVGLQFRDQARPVFERYRAMFSLRNRGGDACGEQLALGLVEDSVSALLRHETCYVLGQMQLPSTVKALVQILERGVMVGEGWWSGGEGEHSMVRHEAAEALGAIEGAWGECEEVLKRFTEDEDVAVAESCVVALDAADYFGISGNAVELDDEKVEDEELDGGYFDENEIWREGVKPAKPKVTTFAMEKNRDVVNGHFNVTQTA